MEGNIFDIQRFCVHDGPGIRTVVFFKGCPLRCIWCHNPESQKSEVSIACYLNKCIGCGACAVACKEACISVSDKGRVFDRAKCVKCGNCAKACLTGAIECLGKRMTAGDILDEVCRDNNFYKNSGGGMTVSGGEPLAQPRFLLELLRGARERGVSVCIETCGFAPKDVMAEVAKYTDVFLFDIKETDNERHERLTGVPFSPIEENLMMLNSMGARIILRCPLVPDINTREEHLRGIARIASRLNNLIEVNVMAYHLLGNGKYDALDMKNEMSGAEAMSPEQKKECISFISKSITEISGRTVKVC